MKNRTKVIVRMVSAAMLALLGLGGGARLATAAGDSSDKPEATTPRPSAATKAKLGHMTATVSSIDENRGTMILTDDRGERRIFQTPPTMKGIDNVEQGDRVSVTYQDSLAVGIITPTDAAQMGKGKAPKPGDEPALCAGNTTTTANVLSVDAQRGQLTFRGAGGGARTVTAVDPAIESKLGALHPGDLIQVMYTEPVATTIAPAPAKN